MKNISPRFFYRKNKIILRYSLENWYIFSLSKISWSVFREVSIYLHMWYFLDISTFGILWVYGMAYQCIIPPLFVLTQELSLMFYLSIGPIRSWILWLKIVFKKISAVQNTWSIKTVILGKPYLLPATSHTSGPPSPAIYWLGTLETKSLILI